MLNRHDLRPSWVRFEGLVGAYASISLIVGGVWAGSIGMLVFGAVVAFPAFGLLWPRLRIEGDRLVLRNLRTRSIPLRIVRGVLPENSGFFGATYLIDLVGEPAMPVWAMHTPNSFGRVSEQRMRERAIRVSKALEAASPTVE